MPGLTVNDWFKKRDALFRLLDADSYPALVESAFSERLFDDSTIIPTFVDTMQRWGDSVRPKTKLAKLFFEDVVCKLGVNKDVSIFQFAECPFSKFVDLLPQRFRKELSDILNGDSVELRIGGFSTDEITQFNDEKLASLDANIFTIDVIEDDFGMHPNVRSAAKNGAVDERLFYQHPDCAEHWESIIIAQNYPTFNKCKYSLDNLWASNEFKVESASDPLRAVVMLGGGGAFSKDVALINALCTLQKFDSKNPLIYTLFDVSAWMLRRSRLRLAIHWNSTNWSKSVNVELVIGDFMAMSKPGYSNRLRNNRGRTIWALTGGTIGNISEAGFFNSMDGVAETGDLLVLSCSVFDKEANPVVFDEEKNDRYVSPAVQALLRSPVQDLIAHLKSPASVDSVMAKIHPSPIEGKSAGITDVNGGRTLTLKTNIGGRDFQLFTHTYYDPLALIQFADQRGWMHVHTAASPYGERDFAQFLFRRK